MSDLEWYLDVGGKQSGPHGAREIVEMVRAGKIPASAHVTAARMGGDWVTAQDLIDAYDELYAKPAKTSGNGPAFTNDPNFTAPPRPTEQLEKSRILTFDREALENTPDPTEALFQAIQAVREKANQKGSAGSSTATPNANRDSFGQLRRPSDPRIPPQLVLVLTLAAIFGLTVYGIVRLVRGKTAEEAAKSPVATRKSGDPVSAPPPAPAAAPGGSLLNAQGGGASAARTAPPPAPVTRPPTTRVMMPSRRTPYEHVPNQGGGARYRDERDPPIVDDEPDVDESDVEVPHEVPESMAVDPSQVPADRLIPEMGTIPGNGPLPGADPYTPPPPAGPPQ